MDICRSGFESLHSSVLQTMAMRHHLTITTIAGSLSLLLLLAASCRDVPMPRTLQQPSNCPLTLGPEDVVTIRVVGEEELTGDYQADTAGFVDFPYIGRFNLKGKTNTSLASHIITQLKEGDLILDPQVSVVIKEHNSGKIVVDGQVQRPGPLPFRTGMTLLEAISKAGGRRPMADRRTVTLTRATGDGTTTSPVPVQAVYEGREPDIRLCPGDRIFVPETVM